MAEEVKYKPSAVKPWSIILALIMPPIFFLLNAPLHMFVQWWVWPAWFPPQWPVMMLFFYLFYKATGVKPSAPTMVALLSIFYVVSGWTYLIGGTHCWTIFPLYTAGMGFFVHGLWADPYKDLFWKYTPGFVAPKDMRVLQAFYEGGTFDLGAWLGPIAFWSLFWSAFYVGGFLAAYMIRKPMIEVERLPFPYAQPTAYVIREFEAEEEGKPRLFNFRLRPIKLFWAGFLIGFAFYIPNAISALTPITFPYYLMAPPFNLNPYTRAILPGAKFNGWFAPNEIVVLAIAPRDALLTGVIWWVLIGIIYPVVGVKMGFLPYYPGIEDTNEYYLTTGPFKNGWFGQLGVPVGLGLWALINYRHHIARFFQALTGKVTATDEPYKMVGLGFIACWLIVLILFVAATGNVVMAIVAIIWYILIQYGWCRVQAEGMHTTAMSYYWGQYFDFGTYLGQWGPRPDPRALPTLTMFASFGGTGFLRQSAIGPANHIQMYKVADVNRTDPRDVLILSAITMVSSAVTVAALTPWWYTTFGGYTRQGCVEYHVWNLPGIWQYTGGTPPPVGAAETLGYTVSGVIFTILCYLARARFPWFFFNPVGVALVSVWGLEHGIFVLWAWVLREVFTRLLGAKGFEEYYMPAAFGFAMGHGLLYWTTAVIAFFTRAIPAMTALPP
ncbi:MAG: hypothetical protein DRJ67_03875 [Thermoprotei archaeon]|nr:MAG: hypothetical protein DRJ67_03875 [Thermoprotei archaeon]